MTLTDKVFMIPANKPEDDFVFSGNGLKHLVVVTSRAASGAEDLKLLDKMMKAIQYNLEEDVTLIIKEHESTLAISSIITSWKDMILFGVSPESVGFSVDYRPYRILSFEDKRLLFADSLPAIGSAAEKKKLIWGLFQEMFLKS